MFKRTKKKYYYEEYFVNDTYLKKLYNVYINKHFADKLLNILAFFAILATVMAVILELLGDVNNKILILTNLFINK